MWLLGRKQIRMIGLSVEAGNQLGDHCTDECDLDYADTCRNGRVVEWI